MGKLRIGVIGCGGIANQKHFPAMKNNADLCEIVAFCDIIEERAKKACEEFGAPGAKFYTDYHELSYMSAHRTSPTARSRSPLLRRRSTFTSRSR